VAAHALAGLKDARGASASSAYAEKSTGSMGRSDVRKIVREARHRVIVGNIIR